MTNANAPQDVRALVQGLHTRSPHEVMGEAASSSLIGSVVTAAIALSVFLFVSTAIVFFAVGPPAARSKPEAEPIAAVPADNATAENLATVGETTGSVDKAVEATARQETENSEVTTPVDAMGIGESKDADAAPDSLENRLDDILKGLE
ncbi:MAG: hypothetical protein HKN47_17010 [Pirellulaceae bacterium]|nr:hypothetical protein [Pirellulaceae bacterium]